MSCGAVITVNMWWFAAVCRVLPCSRTWYLSCRVRVPAGGTVLTCDYCRLRNGSTKIKEVCWDVKNRFAYAEPGVVHSSNGWASESDVLPRLDGGAIGLLGWRTTGR